MACTIFWIDSPFSGRDFWKDGPSRSIYTGAAASMGRQLVAELKSVGVGDCEITFRRRYINEEYSDPSSPEYIPEDSVEFNPDTDSPDKVVEFFAVRERKIGDWNIYGSFEVLRKSDGKVLVYEFDDMDV